jgi:hypothetical protein
MERSDIRGRPRHAAPLIPDFAALNPGYRLLQATAVHCNAPPLLPIVRSRGDTLINCYCANKTRRVIANSLQEALGLPFFFEDRDESRAVDYDHPRLAYA